MWYLTSHRYHHAILQPIHQKSHIIHTPYCSWYHYFGNGVCDVGFNTEEHFFDVGDCCLENPTCMSSSFISTAVDPFCQENLCIESNIFCVKEELGDGICQGHNNGPFCDYDSGDCCLVTENSETNCTCNCICQFGDLYQTQLQWMLG